MWLFDDDVKELLTRAGWHPARSIDISNWEKELEARDFGLWKNAAQILRSIGGLHVVPRTGSTCKYFATPVTFDPILEESASWDELKDWQQELRLRIVPLGLTEDGARVLLASDGSVLSATSDMLFLNGSCLNSGLRCLLLADAVPAELARGS